jgi:hypothetical protein
VKLVLPGPIDTEIWDQPGNAPALFEIEKVSATDCASGIADALAADGFEFYVPPMFPDGTDAKELAVTKSAACDSYIKGMTDVATALRNP